MSRTRHDLPSLTSLAAFEAAAHSLSFKEAAAALNVTPTAISRQVRILEEELGLSLFNRLHRRVTLTGDGEALFASLSGAFQNIAATVQGLQESSQRRLTVGSTSAFATFWLMPRLSRFWALHPEITIHHFISELPVDLERDPVDLAIRFGPGHWPGVETRLLFGDRLHLLCAPSFLDRHGPIESAERLLELPLIQVSGIPGDNWAGWPEVLRAIGLVGPVRLRHLNSYVAAVEAALAGQGVIVGWESQIAGHVAGGRLVRLLNAEVTAAGGYFVTTRPNRPKSPEATLFIEWLATEATRAASLPLKHSEDGSKHAI